MDKPRDYILSEVNQTEKAKYHMISLICGIKKNDRKELVYKQNRCIGIESKLMVTKEKVYRGINKELGINRYILLCIK